MTSNSTILRTSDLDNDLKFTNNIGWVIKHSDLMNVFFKEIDENKNIFFKSPAELSQEKISFDYDNASNSGNYWDIDSWDDGTTEPGSSGSPLFDGETHRIIGQLYGGVASCTNFGYDTYGKTSVSWGLGLNTYLDPNNTGIEFIDGIDAIDLPDPVISLIDDNLNFELADSESDQATFSVSNIGEPESVLSYSATINIFENCLSSDGFVYLFLYDESVILCFFVSTFCNEIQT